MKRMVCRLWIMLCAASGVIHAAEVMRDLPRPRLIVLADMGNESDEEQQMLHLLMYADKIDIEALIAVSGACLHPGQREPYRRTLHPELFLDLLRGYEKVYHNLEEHADGWALPFNLRACVTSGQSEYGMGGVGDGKSSEGSDFIIQIVEEDDPRPVHVVINAGSGTLAQALYDYRKYHTPEEVDAFVSKLRVMENAGQDDAGAWINREFPKIHWVRMIHQNRCYGGPVRTNLGPHVWTPYPYTAKGQDEWAHEHIRKNHGRLGELYPVRLHDTHTFETPDFIEGGGTIPWIGLALPGLTDPSEPSWGGWSGRYTVGKQENVPSLFHSVGEQEKAYLPWYVYADAIDEWTDPATGKTCRDANTAVWRWRQAMWNDFQVRMDWCVKSYQDANHHPVAILNGDASDAICMKDVKAGEYVDLDASTSRDPDGDPLQFKWWVYKEAGKHPYGKAVPIKDHTHARIKFTVPEDAGRKEIHLILEVWDQSEVVPLVDYRRIILNVR